MATWADVQRHVGVEADGKPGPRTLDAIARALGIVKAHQLSDAPTFFSGIRAVTGPLDQVQVDTLNALLISAAHWPAAWLAYGIATAWHEARLKPIEEIGKGKGRRYGVPDGTGQIPYGRGLVQLTWNKNYVTADRKLGLNGALVADYSLALRPDIATAILVNGMEEGWFTGKSLGDYISSGTLAEFEAARRIINGTDRAAQIAGYAVQFLDAVRDGGWS